VLDGPANAAPVSAPTVIKPVPMKLKYFMFGLLSFVDTGRPGHTRGLGYIRAERRKATSERPDIVHSEVNESSTGKKCWRSFHCPTSGCPTTDQSPPPIPLRDPARVFR